MSAPDKSCPQSVRFCPRTVRFCLHCGAPHERRSAFCNDYCREGYKLRMTDIYADIPSTCGKHQAEKDYEGW